MTRSLRHAFRDKTVAKVFADYPAAVRTRLLALREMIYSTAASSQRRGRKGTRARQALRGAPA